MDHLALQIGEIHIVRVGDADRADPGRGQVQGNRRTQTAGADDQHPAVQQFLLALAPHFLENDVARIALDLVIAQHFRPPRP